MDQREMLVLRVNLVTEVNLELQVLTVLLDSQESQVPLD